jgi:hypothetical protein
MVDVVDQLQVVDAGDFRFDEGASFIFENAALLQFSHDYSEAGRGLRMTGTGFVAQILR